MRTKQPFKSHLLTYGFTVYENNFGHIFFSLKIISENLALVLVLSFGILFFYVRGEQDTIHILHLAKY